MTDSKKIKAGDILAVIHYVRVKTIKGDNVEAVDLDNNVGTFGIHGEKLIARALSADQYSSEEKVTQTECIETLLHAVRRPFTVCFDKDNGDERVLRGRLIKADGARGYADVEDLDIEGKSRYRKVDCRTLKWLIVDGVKYVVK